MLRNNPFLFLTKYYSGQCPLEQVQMISSWIWHIPGYFLERPGNEIILIIPVRQFKFNSTWNHLKYQLYEWFMSHESWLIFKIHYVTENYIILTKGDISVGWKEICDAFKSGPIFRDTNCQNWSHCSSTSEIVRQMGMSFDSMSVARQFNEIWPLQCVGGNTPVTCQLFDFLEWCQKFHWQVTLRFWPEKSRLFLLTRKCWQIFKMLTSF